MNLELSGFTVGDFPGLASKAINMRATNSQVVSALTKAGIKFNIMAKGKGLKRENWECDGWMLELSHKNNTEYFDYFTGIGHRVGSRPVAPEVCGIIDSLIMDSSEIHESFDNWCDNFGYDSDSIKALNTYQACIDNAKKLRKVIDNATIEILRELLEDY